MENLKTDYRFSMYWTQPRKSAKRLRKSEERSQFPVVENDKPREYRFGIYKKLPGIRANGYRYGYQRRMSETEEYYKNHEVFEKQGHGHQQYKAEEMRKGEVTEQGQTDVTNQIGLEGMTNQGSPEGMTNQGRPEGMTNQGSPEGMTKQGRPDDMTKQDGPDEILERHCSTEDWRQNNYETAEEIKKSWPQVIDSDQSPKRAGDDDYRYINRGTRTVARDGRKKSKLGLKDERTKPVAVSYEWDIMKRRNIRPRKFRWSRLVSERGGKEAQESPRDLKEKNENQIISGINISPASGLPFKKYIFRKKSRPHNHGSLEMSTDSPGYRYRGFASNNAFHPGRYFRANGSLPHRRWPAAYGSSNKETYLSHDNVSMKPRVVTIVRHGTRPRNTVKILLNRRSVQSFEQLMGDISDSFGPKWKNNKVRKLYTLKGREVQGISDFFRHDDMFVACSNESINEDDFRDIMQEMFPDSPRAKYRQRDFDRPRRKRQPQVPREPETDKRDSGFGEASEGSNSNRESDQEATLIGQGHGQARPEEKRRRDRRDKDKRSLSPAKDSHREVLLESPRDPPKDTFGKGMFDERERARRRQQKMMESEKRALDDERRRRGLVPLKAQEDPFKKMKEREKEKLEARRRREQEKKRQLEEEEKEKRKKEFEEAEKAARARKAAAEKEEREREEQEKAEREKAEREKAEKEKEEQGKTKEKDQEKDQEKDKDKDKDKGVEKEKVKEKDNRESDKHQSKKRQKTKIVRRTKAERQISNDEPVLAKYELGRTLGDGNFAIVRTCKLKAGGQEFAMKVIDKPKLKGKEHMVENEIEIMKDCSHHNIVKLYEEYETPDKLYLVMELVKGGDLFDAITQSVKFGEVDSASMVKDLCHALFYLHSRNIVHRDLKPENLLVHRNKDGSITLKLADFGLAMEVKESIFTVCGTPTYVAPEILSEIGYGLEVDMWAVGVISYILLCGFPPFRSPDRNQTELFEFIKAGAYEFLSPYWDYISNAAKDMIQHLLVVEKKRRYTAVDVLSHPWIIAGGDMSVLMDTARVDEQRRERRKELEVQARQSLESYTRMKEKRKAKEE